MSILELRIDDLQNNDIATELKLSLRTVQQIRKKMCEAWRDSLQE